MIYKFKVNQPYYMLRRDMKIKQKGILIGILKDFKMCKKQVILYVNMKESPEILCPKLLPYLIKGEIK